MMAIAGFFVTLVSANWTRTQPDMDAVYFAFILIGLSIALSWIAVFGTILIERFETSGRILFALPGTKRDPMIHPVTAKKMDYREAIKEKKKQLAVEMDPVKRSFLKHGLTSERRGLFLMYFVDAPVTWYEFVRVGLTLIIMILSFIGIGIMLFQLTSNTIEIAAPAQIQPVYKNP